MSVSDTEVSDVTWTDNGTFNLSEGHTPQTENSDGTFVSSTAAFRLTHGLIIEMLVSRKEIWKETHGPSN